MVWAFINRLRYGLFGSRRRLLVVILLSLLAGGVGAHYGLRYVRQRHARRFLQESLQADREKRGEDALKLAQASVVINPHALEAYLLQIKWLAQAGQPEMLEHCLDEMVAKNPDQGRAYACRGLYRLKTGQAQAAAEDLAQSLALAPADVEAVRLATEYWSSQGEWETSRSYAVRWVDTNPNDPAGLTRLADLEARLGDPAKAIAVLRSAVKLDPANAEALYALVGRLCEAGRVVEAADALSKATPGQRDETLLKMLKARLAYAQGHWFQAAHEFTELRPQVLQRRPLLAELEFWLGDCYGQMGNVSQRIEHWRAALQVAPGWSSLRRRLVGALALSGRLSEAIDEARQGASGRQRGVEDDLQLTHLLVVQAMQFDPPQRKWADIELLVETLRQSKDHAIEAALLEAELRLAQNDPAAARKVLVAAVKQFPEALEARLALAAVAYQRDDVAEAMRWLEGAKANAGDSFRFRVAQARYLLWSQGATAGAALRQLADGPVGDVTEQGKWYAAIALAASCAGDDGLVTQLCNQLGAAETPHYSPACWLLQLEAGFRSGHSEGLELLLKQIEQAEGKGAIWHAAQALNLVVHAAGKSSALASARQHLATARELAPGLPSLSLLAAKIDVLSGDRDSAAGNYLRAIQQGERRWPVVRAILQYLYAQQRYVEAHEVVVRLIRPLPELLLTLADGRLTVELPSGDVTHSLRAAEGLAAGSTQAWDYLWLALVAEIPGRRAEHNGDMASAQACLVQSTQSLRKAAEINPEGEALWTLACVGNAKGPEVGLAVAMRLTQQGKFDEAFVWLERVAPQADRAALADAAIHILSVAPSAGQREQIEKLLTPVIDKLRRPAQLLERLALAYDAQQQYAKSEALYREAIGKDATCLAALNNLAYHLALQHRQLDEALELINKAVKIAGPTGPLLDTRAIVHEARGELAGALADITQAIAKTPGPACFFHQARILAAMKDQTGAQQAETKAKQLGFTPQLLNPLERKDEGGRMKDE